MDIDGLYKALNLELIEIRNFEYRFRCPDWDGHHKHGDRTGKLYINAQKQVAHCWVAGGFSLTQLVAHIRNCSIADADIWLRQFNSGDKEYDSFIDEINEIFNVDKPPKQPSLPYFNPQILDDLVFDHPWFDERKISVQKDFLCGFQDHNAPAIIFSHFWENKLVGYQTRRLEGPGPKYINTGAFPRESTLWGYHKALENSGTPIIVESVPTALALISHGYSAIATFGAQVTPAQSKLLRRFDKIILSPDNDIGGQIWYTRLVTNLIDYVLIHSLGLIDGQGTDLGDFIKSHNKGDLDEFISNQELVFSPDFSVKL